MIEELFVIVCDVPERISHYTANLRSFTSRFMFFSDMESFTTRMSSAKVKVLILDVMDEKHDAGDQVRWLRQFELFRLDVLIVITPDAACTRGVEALNAGANDYLPFCHVARELTARVRMHLNASDKEGAPSDIGIDLDAIYPLEDRLLLKSALSYISTNISFLKKVSDLASYLGKNERELNRLFSAHLGKTASEFVREQRISLARNLLLKTRFTIAQVADAVGYSSSANFSTAFRTSMGCTPREYRGQRLLTL